MASQTVGFRLEDKALMRLQDAVRGRGSQKFSKASKLTVVGAAALVAAACGSTSTPASSSGASNPGVPSSITVSAFTTDIASTMSALKPLTQYATKGANTLLIGVILPDTTSSVRWVDFDQPYLTAALADAGFNQNQFRIDNAQGSDATELDVANADINLGAKVLIMCPLDGPTGLAIAQLAQSKGVTLISYDRAVFHVGQGLLRQLQQRGCRRADRQRLPEPAFSRGASTTPRSYVLNGGEDTDPNAISFASGYNKVVWGQSAKTVSCRRNQQPGNAPSSARTSRLAGPTPRADTIFQQEYTGHPSINATIEANDGLANAVITDLKNDNVPAKKIPTTGQDATAQGMAWILEGYQCGSVYKPVYKEAQDAVAHG